jgi:2-polyprenyl-3-methyl-5-hydroxy-6-metoxy-1,4-benzoquinol methylase
MDSTLSTPGSVATVDGLRCLDTPSQRTKSDRESSLRTGEFVWDMAGLTEAGRMITPALLKRVQSLKPRRILDLGCGNGALAGCLASCGFSVCGTDMSASGMAIAQQSYPKVSFFESQMGDPLPASERGTCDLVISTEVIEHLPFPRQIFARAREALVPGGSLILTTPYHGYLKNLAIALTGRFDEHWHPLKDFGHVKFFSPDTLRELFVEERFQVTEIARLGRIAPFAKSMMMVAQWNGAA